MTEVSSRIVEANRIGLLVHCERVYPELRWNKLRSWSVWRQWKSSRDLKKGITGISWHALEGVQVDE